jgi:hypothetical protein
MADSENRRIRKGKNRSIRCLAVLPGEARIGFCVGKRGVKPLTALDMTMWVPLPRTTLSISAQSSFGGKIRIVQANPEAYV